MTKFLANLSLVVIGLALILGNYWYVFGLWPQSWSAFVVFGIATLAFRLISDAVLKESK